MYRILLIESGYYLWLIRRNSPEGRTKDHWKSKTDAYLDLISAINQHNNNIRADRAFIDFQNEDLRREVTFSDFVIIREANE